MAAVILNSRMCAAEASTGPPIQAEGIPPVYENPSNLSQNVCFSTNLNIEAHPGFQNNSVCEQRTGYPQNSGYEQNTRFAQNFSYDQNAGIPQNSGIPQNTRYPVQKGPVVVQTFSVQPSMKLSYHPFLTTCPSCHEQILTTVTCKPGVLTWLSCGGIMLTGCVFGCCLIPFFVDSLKNTLHHCPRCNYLIGMRKPI